MNKILSRKLLSLTVVTDFQRSGPSRYTVPYYARMQSAQVLILFSLFNEGCEFKSYVTILKMVWVNSKYMLCK